MSRGCVAPPAAFAGIVGAEFDPADRRARGVAEARIESAVVAGTAPVRTAIPNRMAATANPFPVP